MRHLRVHKSNLKCKTQEHARANKSGLNLFEHESVEKFDLYFINFAGVKYYDFNFTEQARV